MIRTSSSTAGRHLDAAFALSPLGGLPLRLARQLLSFETAFVLYLFAGAYKSNPRLAGLFPLDPTMAFFALGVMAGALVVWREGLYRPGLDMLLAYLLFAGWAFVTYGWTPIRGYPSTKLQELVILNSWCIVAGGMIIANRYERVVRFLALALLVAAPLALDWLSGYSSISAYVKQETSVHAAARVFAFGGIVAFVAFVYTPLLSLRWVAAGGLFGLFFLTLLVAGARTLLVSAVLVLLLPGLVRTRLTRGRLLLHRSQLIVIASLMLIVAYVAYLFATGHVPWTLVRLGSLFFGKGFGDSDGALHVADNERFMFYEVSLYQWLKAPFLGQGLGSFPFFAFKLDIRAYPHNIFLELLLETGIIGLLLFLPTLILPLTRVRLARLRADPAYLCLLMLVIANFFYGLGSGDIPSFSFTHAILGMLLVRPPAAAPDPLEPEPADADPDEPDSWGPDPYDPDPSAAPDRRPAGGRWAAAGSDADDAAEAMATLEAAAAGPARDRPSSRR